MVLDDIKESPEDARFQLQDFWNEKVVDYEDLSGNVPRDNIEVAANMVTMCVAICLNGLDLSLYNTLTSVLISQINGEEPSVIEMRECFTANIYRLGEDKFNTAVAEYMESDVFESEDIEGLLEDLPEPPSRNEEEKKSTDGQYEQLTNRQLMILFDLFLNKGFSTEYCNQNALATLLSRVSGRSMGSIRQKIREGVDYEVEDVCNDVNMLAQLLEPIDDSIAEKMRKLIE